MCEALTSRCMSTHKGNERENTGLLGNARANKAAGGGPVMDPSHGMGFPCVCVTAAFAAKAPRLVGAHRCPCTLDVFDPQPFGSRCSDSSYLARCDHKHRRLLHKLGFKVPPKGMEKINVAWWGKVCYAISNQSAVSYFVLSATNIYIYICIYIYIYSTYIHVYMQRHLMEEIVRHDMCIKCWKQLSLS